MGEKMEKALSITTTALVALIAVFALLIVAGKPFGVHAYAVLSGSMEPAYSTGSLIYVREVPASQLGEGDVITFMTGKDTTVTHRIIDLETSEDGITRFQTQGDANSTPDGELVHPDNVVGTPVLEIPFLGYVVNFIQFPPGTYIAISVGAIAVFLMFLPDLFPSRKEEDEEESDEEKPIRGRHAGKMTQPSAIHPAYAQTNPVGYAPQQQVAYTQTGRSAGEYGHSMYARKPYGQQGQPMGELPQRQVWQPQQGRQVQRRFPDSSQQIAWAPQGVHAYGQQTVQRPQVQGVQPRQAAQQMRTSQPQQVSHMRNFSQPAQSAQPRFAKRTATSTFAGGNNPRIRNGQCAQPNKASRSNQNTAQTHQPQARPARRPLP